MSPVNHPPPPIDQPTISAVTSRILPLHAFVDALPVDLLSPLLFQRHRFLHLHPSDDPLTYLTWPPLDHLPVLTQLHALSLPPPTPHNPTIAYSALPDALLAHVQLSASDLRLIFLWDPHDHVWKYHNLALMPFPPQSRPSPHLPSAVSSTNRDVEPNEDDDDSYWNAYDDPDAHSSDVLPPENDLSEDAYWARYSQVQGTADSSNPTPPLPIQNLLAQIPFNPPTAASRSDLSPTDLSDRLRALTALADNIHEPSLNDRPQSLSAQYWNGFGAPLLEPAHKNTQGHASPVINQSIRGLFDLWSAEKSPTDKHVLISQFLSVVQEALNDHDDHTD